MINKRLVFTIGCFLFLELIPLHLIAQESYTVESLRNWIQIIESERAPIEIISTCKPDKGIVPICGMQNPEDLAVTPSENWILFSERIPASETVDAQGNIGALGVSDHKISKIYSPESGKAERNLWGSKECTSPPSRDEFTPLGMDLSVLNSGELRLLVTNISGRSSIEFFEINESAEKVEAIWRGCIKLPSGINANSVASVPTGGFVVSTMGTLAAEEQRNRDLMQIVEGKPFGKILEWTAEQGWRELPGGHISAPNGILVSPDSKTVYFASVGTNEVIIINRIGEPERKTVLMPKVDNLRWTKEGKILAASLRGSTLSVFRDCANLRSGACGQEFAVVEIEPNTLAWKELIHHQGPPIGLVTSALKIGNRIYMGTAMGDRMAYKDMSQ
jgi:hypothetical protein